MNRIGDAAALGYAAFALTLWIASMFPAGWFDATDAAPAMVLSLVVGGGVLALAGVLQHVHGHRLDAFVFLMFAGYWCARALAWHTPIGDASVSPGFIGWFDAVWALVAACAWLATWHDGMARLLFMLGLSVSLLMLALGAWTGIDALTVLGGYVGLVTAIVGIYLAAAELINGVRGHVVLPLGDSDSGHRRTPPG